MGDFEEDGYNVFVTADVSKRDRTSREETTDIAFQQYQQLNGRFATPYGSFVSQYPTAYRESAPGSKNFAVNRATADARLRPALAAAEEEQEVPTPRRLAEREVPGRSF